MGIDVRYNDLAAEFNARTPEQEQVEQFWLGRTSVLSLDDEKKICDAYVEHIIGGDFHKMSKVHAGKIPAKKDYAGFYGALRDVLNFHDDELGVLVREGFDFAGLMCKLAERHGYSVYTPSGGIVANMLSNK